VFILFSNIVFCGSLRWIGTLILYTLHKSSFDCHGGGVLHGYLVVLLVVLASIILSLCAIVYVSAQGGKPSVGRRMLQPRHALRDPLDPLVAVRYNTDTGFWSIYPRYHYQPWPEEIHPGPGVRARNALYPRGRVGVSRGHLGVR